MTINQRIACKCADLSAAIAAAEREQRNCSPAEAALEAAVEYLEAAGCHCFDGVESVTAHNGNVLYYLNAGDTYAATIGIAVGDWGDVSEPFECSWGDWLDSEESAYCEENGEIKCGYCGEFTPCAEEWRETRCEHCCHNVSTGEPMAEPVDDEE